MEVCKKILRACRQPVLVTVILMVICGLGFPLLLNGLSALLFPKQAAGSLVEVNGTAVGSRHIGQAFTEPYFMKGRPSAVNYNTFEDPGEGGEIPAPSSGSNNYGPSNPALRERVEADMEAFLAANPGVKKEDIPTDLLTASGSGLDPHISPESAAIQLPAISEASGLTMEELEKIVEHNTEGKLLGLFGGERVNVLGVNVEIAEAMGLTS